MLTPDLLRVGPPALAAVASDCGLMTSGVLPLFALSRPVGAIQLLGAQGWSIESGHLDRLAPLADVLAAKLADVAALVRATAPPLLPDTCSPIFAAFRRGCVRDGSIAQGAHPRSGSTVVPPHYSEKS